MDEDPHPSVPVGLGVRWRPWATLDPRTREKKPTWITEQVRKFNPSVEPTSTGAVDDRQRFCDTFIFMQNAGIASIFYETGLKMI